MLELEDARNLHRQQADAEERGGGKSDAATIADILTALDTKSDSLADSAVPDLAFLQLRILNAAKSVHGCESDRKREGGSHE